MQPSKSRYAESVSSDDESDDTYEDTTIIASISDTIDRLEKLLRKHKGLRKFRRPSEVHEPILHCIERATTHDLTIAGDTVMQNVSRRVTEPATSAPTEIPYHQNQINGVLTRSGERRQWSYDVDVSLDPITALHYELDEEVPGSRSAFLSTESQNSGPASDPAAAPNGSHTIEGGKARAEELSDPSLSPDWEAYPLMPSEEEIYHRKYDTWRYGEWAPNGRAEESLRYRRPSDLEANHLHKHDSKFSQASISTWESRRESGSPGREPQYTAQPQDVHSAFSPRSLGPQPVLEDSSASNTLRRSQNIRSETRHAARSSVAEQALPGPSRQYRTTIEPPVMYDGRSGSEDGGIEAAIPDGIEAIDDRAGMEVVQRVIPPEFRPYRTHELMLDARSGDSLRSRSLASIGPGECQRHASLACRSIPGMTWETGPAYYERLLRQPRLGGIDKIDPDGKSPAMVAAELGLFDEIQDLDRNRCRLLERDDEDGKTVLHFAVVAHNEKLLQKGAKERKRSIEYLIMWLLADIEADLVNVLDENGRSALWYCTNSMDLNMVEQLVRSGALLQWTTQHGESRDFLQMARRQRNGAAIVERIEHMDPSVVSNTNTAAPGRAATSLSTNSTTSRSRADSIEETRRRRWFRRGPRS